MTKVPKKSSRDRALGPDTGAGASAEVVPRLQLKRDLLSMRYDEQRAALSPKGKQGPNAPKEGTHGKAEIKQILLELLGTVWLTQSGANKPIQLTPQLITIIRTVTTLSEKDIQLLWRTPPRTDKKALEYLNHSLRASITAKTMKQLKQWKTQLILGGKVKSPAADGGDKGALVQSGIEGREELVKAIAAALQGKSPQDKSANTNALKSLLKALLQTEKGKLIKARVLKELLSKKGAPLLAVVGTMALASMIANNSTIPSVPEIPLGDNLSVKVDFQGSMRHLKGVTISFKFTLGGSDKDDKEQQREVIALPKALHAFIGRIDKKTLSKWIIDRAHWEYEWAGPDNEFQKLAFYRHCQKHQDELPDTQLVAEDLCRRMFKLATENKINALKGKGGQTDLSLPIKHMDDGLPGARGVQIWDHFIEVKGIKPRLQWLTGLLVPNVPYQAFGIKQISFQFGKHPSLAVDVARQQPRGQS